MKKRVMQLGTSMALMAGSLLTPMAVFAQDTDEFIPRNYFGNFQDLFQGVLTFVMVVAALLVFLYLILGGIEWITSGGDSGKTEKARNKITAAVVGIIILAASYAILLIVLNFLGFRNLGDAIDSTQDAGIPTQEQRR